MPNSTPKLRINHGGVAASRLGTDHQHRVPPKSDNFESAPAASDARDLALVAAHRAGDQTALPELLTGYQDRLFGVCLRMVSDAEEARDLTQDAMVRIIQGLHQFDGRSKLSTWMIRVAMNVCLTSLRRRQIRRRKGIEPASGWLDPAGGSDARTGSGPRFLDHAAASEPGPDLSVERLEERRHLYRALDQIEPEQRAMLILRDMHDMDYKHIADVLDIPEGTVKSRLFRARAALRERFEAQNPGPRG